jgi:hypothetical protein
MIDGKGIDPLRPPSSRAIALAKRYRPMKVTLLGASGFGTNCRVDRGAEETQLSIEGGIEVAQILASKLKYQPSPRPVSWGRAIVCRIIKFEKLFRRLALQTFVDALCRAAECRS